MVTGSRTPRQPRGGSANGELGPTQDMKKAAPLRRRLSEMVPEVGLEPTSLAAVDFLPTSAFAAVLPAQGVRGLEHAFTVAPRSTALP